MSQTGTPPDRLHTPDLTIAPAVLVCRYHVFSESAELCRAKSCESASEGDSIRLGAIVSDVKVLDLQPEILSITGLQNVEVRINGGSFSCVVLTYEGSYAFVELDV